VQAEARGTLVTARREEWIERFAPDIRARAATVVGKENFDIGSYEMHQGGRSGLCINRRQLKTAACPILHRLELASLDRQFEPRGLRVPGDMVDQARVGDEKCPSQSR